MPVSLPNYVKIKDNYCISYYGQNKEYLVQLSLLRPIIESTFKGIQIYISCEDSSLYLLEGESKILSKNETDTYRNNFAYIREIKSNLDKHPIESIMEESGLPCGPINFVKKERSTSKCALFTNGSSHTRKLSGKQITKIIESIEQNNYSIEINPLRYKSFVNDFDLVVGVENEYVYKAASCGVETTLIATGNGEDLFRKMFPKSQIIHPEP